MKKPFSSSFTTRKLLLISGVAVAFLFCQAGDKQQGAVNPRISINRQVARLPLGAQVIIDGILVNNIESLVNEGQATEVVQLREANGTTRALPGKLGFGKLILTRAWTGNLDWYNWRNAVINGSNAMRRMVSVVYHPTASTENRFNFPASWPTKWVVSPFSTKGNTVPMETLELVYERMELK